MRAMDHSRGESEEALGATVAFGIFVERTRPPRPVQYRYKNRRGMDKIEIPVSIHRHVEFYVESSIEDNLVNFFIYG